VKIITGTLFAIGFVALAVGWFVRIRIFNRLEQDRVAAEMLEDTSVFSFGDFLWITLYRKRAEIGDRFRRIIAVYFWLTLSVVLLWAAGFAIHWLAA